MENPVSTVTNAAKSAFNVKFILGMIFGLLIVFAVLDFSGATPWILTPISKFKAWNEERKAKAAAKG